jgi:hypothetical protein
LGAQGLFGAQKPLRAQEPSGLGTPVGPRTLGGPGTFGGHSIFGGPRTLRGPAASRGPGTFGIPRTCESQRAQGTLKARGSLGARESLEAQQAPIFCIFLNIIVNQKPVGPYYTTQGPFLSPLRALWPGPSQQPAKATTGIRVGHSHIPLSWALLEHVIWPSRAPIRWA